MSMPPQFHQFQANQSIQPNQPYQDAQQIQHAPQYQHMDEREALPSIGDVHQRNPGK